MENYAVARKLASAKGFVVENLGLGSYEHVMIYAHMPNPGASKLDSNGTETAQIVTLDNYVREKNLPSSVPIISLTTSGC